MTFAWTIYDCPRCGRALRDLQCASGNTFGGVFWSDGYPDYPMLMQELGLKRCPGCHAFFWMREVATRIRMSDDGEEEGDEEEKQRKAKLEAASEPVITPAGHELWLAINEPGAGKWTPHEMRSARRVFWWEQNSWHRAVAAHDAYCQRRGLGRLHRDERKIDEAEDRQNFPSMGEGEDWERSIKRHVALRIGNEAEARRIFALDCPLPDGPEFRANLQELVSLPHQSGNPPDDLGIAEIHRELGNFQAALEHLDAAFEDDFAIFGATLRERILREETTVFCLNPEAL